MRPDLSRLHDLPEIMARGYYLLLPFCVAAAAAHRVSVRVRTPIDAPASRAKEAWLEYTWRTGGGLPVVVTSVAEQRTLWPIKLDEVLLPTEDDDDPSTIRYAVTDSGPLLSIDFVDGTHNAKVSFAERADGCSELLWDVEFEVGARRRFWQAFTETTVGGAAAALASSLATPTRCSDTIRLTAPSVRAAMDEWLDFVWDQGGGLLPLPPLSLDRGDASQSGGTRLIVPPFLKERLVSVDVSRGEIRYTVDNPGYLTFQVHVRSRSCPHRCMWMSPPHAARDVPSHTASFPHEYAIHVACSLAEPCRHGALR